MLLKATRHTSILNLGNGCACGEKNCDGNSLFFSFSQISARKEKNNGNHVVHFSVYGSSNVPVLCGSMNIPVFWSANIFLRVLCVVLKKDCGMIVFMMDGNKCCSINSLDQYFD